jgi:hypothetical protein
MPHSRKPSGLSWPQAAQTGIASSLSRFQAGFTGGSYTAGVDGEHNRRRVRSFLIGGVVGASAALAAMRRRRPRERTTPAGLAAFEEAPCYRELVERERSSADAL